MSKKNKQKKILNLNMKWNNLEWEDYHEKVKKYPVFI